MEYRWMLAGLAVAMVVLALGGWAVWATDAEVFLSLDSTGETPVTEVNEGDQVWICVHDEDQNVYPALRDKMWADVLILDPKTGALIVWDTGGYFGSSGDLMYDYLEETSGNSGLFVSRRLFQIGQRESDGWPLTEQTHVVDVPWGGVADDFQWGDYVYAEQGGLAMRFAIDPAHEDPLGRFENMDTLVVIYQDPDDAYDVALGQVKISDTTATIEWDQEVYAATGPGADYATASLLIQDADENLYSDDIEYVPVFILVNPGSWNPVAYHSATDFWELKTYGGVANLAGEALEQPIRWHTIYDSGNTIDLVSDGGSQSAEGTYYVEYPTAGDANVAVFDTETASGVTQVMFYAQETGTDTGVFQLILNSILVDLGFASLDVRDVLVAYYIDPNDFDDVCLDVAYAGEKQHSLTSFVDSSRQSVDGYELGKDRLHVQVIDANANVNPCSPEEILVHVYDVHGEDDGEWLTAYEISPNSPVFFTIASTLIAPVWHSLGSEAVGAIGLGGYQLQLDNFRMEAFNEDSLIARYNDVYYDPANLALLGDGDANTAFPPAINVVRVGNDVSFDITKVFDNQVFAGGTQTMHFIDGQGDPVSDYWNGDCIFIEVIDTDQNEDPLGRERISGYWDGEQSAPFAPLALNAFGPGYERSSTHPTHHLLGDTNIFNDGTAPNIYMLNPRNGRWAAIDLFETGDDTGVFVSTTCVELISPYEGVPTLNALPGDTLFAVYQDPSNHSDSCWISIKVGIGGGTSATFRVDERGNVAADQVFHASSFATGAADVAEWVQISEPVEPGDVLEHDPANPGAYRLSSVSFSQLIAGVVSTEPGIILGSEMNAIEQALLALTGIVPVKVTDEGGPILPGDLLVASSTPGYAMRWSGGEPCPSALVGKALEPMTTDAGIILVLLTAH